MHIHNLQRWQHRHRFNVDAGTGERNTHRVIILTLSMMIIEISAGYVFGSMALLADGWHMGTHAVALGITAFAYYYARKHLSAIVSIVTHYPKSPEFYKDLLAEYEEIVHVTVEVNAFEGEPCIDSA